MKRALLLAALVLIGSAVAQGTEELRIDPLLLKQVETVWSVIGQDANPLWPGWNAATTPMMIYIPGEQEVLIGHPSPPDDFARYEGPLAVPGKSMFFRDGPTTVKWDGQNTSREMYGQETLILADTVSNRKLWLRGWLADPRPTEEKLEELPYESLRADPYEQMAMIAHEAFHVFQMSHLPHKVADERDVRLYPCLSVDNNVGFALEGEALNQSLRAEDDAEVRAAATRWLAIRRHRRAALPAKAVDYEDRNEFIEGTAKYIETVLMRELETRTPDPALFYAQGFQGFDDLGWFRERRLESLLGNMRGEVNVNNDPYGTSPIRGRLYFSGMGIAMLLDRIAPGWKDRIADPGETLTALAEEAIGATDGELEQEWERVTAGEEYQQLVQEKTRLAEEGQRDTQNLLEGITEGPNTELVIDYAPLETRKIGLSFTPFGVRALDADRTIYTLVPISAVMSSNDYGFDQSTPAPTLEDRNAHRFEFQLNQKVPAQTVAKLIQRDGEGPWEVDDLDLELPGVKIRAPHARIELHGNKILIEFLPLADSDKPAGSSHEPR